MTVTRGSGTRSTPRRHERAQARVGTRDGRDRAPARRGGTTPARDDRIGLLPTGTTSAPPRPARDHSSYPPAARYGIDPRRDGSGPTAVGSTPAAAGRPCSTAGGNVARRRGAPPGPAVQRGAQRERGPDRPGGRPTTTAAPNDGGQRSAAKPPRRARHGPDARPPTAARARRHGSRRREQQRERGRRRPGGRGCQPGSSAGTGAARRLAAPRSPGDREGSRGGTSPRSPRPAPTCLRDRRPRRRRRRRPSTGGGPSRAGASAARRTTLRPPRAPTPPPAGRADRAPTAPSPRTPPQTRPPGARAPQVTRCGACRPCPGRDRAAPHPGQRRRTDPPTANRGGRRGRARGERRRPGAAAAPAQGLAPMTMTTGSAPAISASRAGSADHARPLRRHARPGAGDRAADDPGRRERRRLAGADPPLAGRARRHPHPAAADPGRPARAGDRRPSRCRAGTVAGRRRASARARRLGCVAPGPRHRSLAGQQDAPGSAGSGQLPQTQTRRPIPAPRPTAHRRRTHPPSALTRSPTAHSSTSSPERAKEQTDDIHRPAAAASATTTSSTSRRPEPEHGSATTPSCS